MIDMCVCQDDEIERLEWKPEIKGREIASVRFTTALKHAAIDQETRACSLEQEAGTRYFTSGAKKADTHDRQGFCAAGTGRC